MDVLLKQTNEKWICFIRAHSASKGFRCESNNDKVIDVTDYPEMSHLMLVADVLITDYSSSAGDFVLTGKPVVLYHKDYQEYLSSDRSFYFELKDIPYFFANNQDELENIICSVISENSAEENCKNVLDFYGACESGGAAEKCVSWILAHKKL